MKKIAVIGAGGWGLALGLLLNEKKHQVTFWCYDEKEKNDILQHRENKRCLPGIKIPLEISFTNDMKEALQKADIAIMAVPSKAIRSTAQLMKEAIEPQTIVVNVSKGIEEHTLLCLADVINEEITNPVVVLSGPSHAEEVARHIPTTVVVSSTDMVKACEVQELFMNEYFRVYTNDDLIGVELGGALKNVIALAAGIVEGMGYGDNTKAALITRGIAEMSRLGVEMGGKMETFAGLTGIGDLVVTCTSGHSRNRRAGELVGQGFSIEEAMKQVNMVVEGVPTTKAAYALMKKYNVEMPILTAINGVLFEGKPVKETIYSLMMRDKKDEL
ncbi:MAG: NAD(P)H-dependent glycerol-3-phosphate dehydrogenase [Candidatus Cellulosilyticum pullistercoris]|uniref:Glycerol-3-phosphate dehydrogenase [NAD(P)+] n=1 Tax=Candidatus Cellulosilyticum pullistercoris TaxID=2838521 RepID=A0A9E2NP93_9FIRM|nr:NAD(P)H-dependent glycerol-3-phosphate dehydrogenase [Candidatus Cellulosilyticum pullistercoris]